MAGSMQSLGLPRVRQCGEAQCPVRPVRAGAAAVPLAETYQAVTGHVAHTRNLRCGQRKDHAISKSRFRRERIIVKEIIWGYFRSIR